MNKKDKGITIVALSITIIILLILAGVSISSIKGEKSSIKEAIQNTENAQRKSIIEKIEADLYNEKVKNGKMPTEDNLTNLINEKGYGTITEDSESGENMLVTAEGQHEILFSEIIGWE